MYITNHLVESYEDKMQIYSRIHFKTSEYDPKENELFFCIMDEEDVIGCAVVSHISSVSSSLDEIVLLEKYVGKQIEYSLLNYIAFELKSIGKSYLVINHAKYLKDKPDYAWLRALVNTDSMDNLLIKLDGMTQVELNRKIG